MDTLIECEVVATGEKAWLPFDVAHHMAALGRVRLPAPKPDMRYAQPSALPLSSSWQDGKFWPTRLMTRLH